MTTTRDIRSDFPILSRRVGPGAGKPLVYLDNAATTQKPRHVIETVDRFYQHENANIHRGVHYLSMHATDAYDRARERIAEAIGANHPAEVIFVRGTTEAINLVASSFAGDRFEAGDEIVLTTMEHHANIVPWQLLAKRKGLVLKWTPVTDSGEIDLDAFRAQFSARTKLATFTQVSNALGTINPVKEMIAIAREFGAHVLVDGAQGVAHGTVNLAELGADFYAFSGHKVVGPDGIGVLWGRRELLDSMPPYQGGGDMIERVSIEKTTFRHSPERFEAGTPNISGAIGLGAAFDYLAKVGWDTIEANERDLLDYATARLGEVEGIRILGPQDTRGKVAVISFTMDSAHPHDIGTILDTEGVAIRAGHHCAQPLMDRFQVAGTARASFAFYNNRDDVDRLMDGILKVKKYFG
ncbi:MAG: cysteine desulfurase [Verrucomicrobiae bacterium]|nr:cysteine desulfurase [Verrucomicrobiae bacterium]